MALSREEIRMMAEEQARFNRLAAEFAEEQRSIRDVILDQTKNLKFQQTLKQDILRATNQIYKLEYDVRTEYDKELGTRQSQISIEKDIEKTLKSKKSLEQDIISLSKEGSKLGNDLAESLQEQVNQANILLNTLKKQAETSKEIRSNFGVSGFQGLSEIFQKIGGKASQLSTPFEKMAEASREVVQDGVENNNKIFERQGILDKIRKGELKANKENLEGIEIIGKKGKAIYGGAAREALKAGTANVKNIGAPIGKFKLGMKGLGAGFKALGPLIKKALGPVGLILTAVKAIQALVAQMFKASAESAKLQRNLMVSAEEARAIRDRTYQIARNAHNLADTQGKNILLQEHILKAMEDTNKALGTAIDFTQELGKEFGGQLLVQSAILKDNFGLSADAIAEIQKEAIVTGESVEDITKNMLGTVAATSLAGGFMFDMNEVIEEATKTSGELRLNFKNSNVAIAKGIVQTKRLGIELKDLQNITGKLLDFESSIASEMEAELLTGRRLNLEKARLAALNGDLVTLGQELFNQGVDYNELENMNVIQRQAFADAVGMSVDQLSDALKKQEEYNALQQRALATGVKIGDIEKQSLKEIFEENKKLNISEKQVIEALGQEIYLRKQAEDAQKKFNETLASVKEKFAELVSGEKLDKFADGVARFATFINKFVNSVEYKGLGRTLLGGISEDPLKVQPLDNRDEAQDFISRPGQPIQKFRKDDIIVGGTNLGGGNEEVVTLLKELITAVKAGGDVYMDGAKVGKSIALATSRIG